MSEKNDDAAVKTPADLLVKMAELGTVAQAAFVQAERVALATMLAGIAGATVPQVPATDAEVESGFDNMPV